MASGVDVNDIDRRDFVHEFIDRETRKGVYHTRIKPRTQNRRDARLGAIVATLPFIVTVPRRRFADLGGVFVNGGVDIGSTGLNAGL